MREHSRNIKWWIMSRLVYFGTVYSNQCQSWRKTDEGTWKSRMHHTRGACFMSDSSQCKTEGWISRWTCADGKPAHESLTRGQRITIHLSAKTDVETDHRAQIWLKRQQYGKTLWKPLNCGVTSPFSRSHVIWGCKEEWYSALHSDRGFISISPLRRDHKQTVNKCLWQYIGFLLQNTHCDSHPAPSSH